MSRNVSDRFRHDPSPEPGGEKPVRYATLLLSAVGALSGACGSSAGPTSPPGPHANYYVDASAGNDGNPGDSAQPFKTVQQAAAVVNPGDVVVVRNGTYTGGSNAVLSIDRGGTAASWVVFTTATKWGAILDGQGGLGAQGVSDAGVSVNASYVRIEGFDIRWVYHDAFSVNVRSEEHTSELQSLTNLVCRLLLEKKKKKKTQ